jgi:hypothetical protein
MWTACYYEKKLFLHASTSYKVFSFFTCFLFPYQAKPFLHASTSYSLSLTLYLSEGGEFYACPTGAEWGGFLTCFLFSKQEQKGAVFTLAFSYLTGADSGQSALGLFFRTPNERARIPGQSQAQHEAAAATAGFRIAFPWQPPGKYSLRTHDDIKAVQEAIHREEIAVGSAEALGYKLKSPLLEIN